MICRFEHHQSTTSHPIECRPDYDRDVAAARAQPTPGEWEAGWAEGKAMTLEQAIAYGLENTAER